MRITETWGETSGRHRGGVDITAEKGRFSEVVVTLGRESRALYFWWGGKRKSIYAKFKKMLLPQQGLRRGGTPCLAKRTAHELTRRRRARSGGGSGV